MPRLRRAPRSLPPGSPAILLAAAVAAAGCSAAGSDADAAGRTGSAPAPQTVAIDAHEFAFDPSSVVVEAGTVTFAVTNSGTVEHELEILDGERVVDEVEGLVPGLTRDLTVTLAPGRYRYVCRIAGHEAAGMQGTLTVE
jgi:iron uptake system component EfeO